MHVPVNIMFDTYPEYPIAYLPIIRTPDLWGMFRRIKPDS